jgi:hypothetical protein
MFSSITNLENSSSHGDLVEKKSMPRSLGRSSANQISVVSGLTNIDKSIKKVNYYIDLKVVLPEPQKKYLPELNIKLKMVKPVKMHYRTNIFEHPNFWLE